MLRVESGQGTGALLPDLLWEAQGMAGSMVSSKHTGFHPFPSVGAPAKGAGVPPSRMDIFSLHCLTPDSGLEGSIPGSSVTLTNVHISAQVLQSLLPEHSVQPRPDPGSPCLPYLWPHPLYFLPIILSHTEICACSGPRGKAPNTL